MEAKKIKQLREKRGETCRQFAERIGVNWRTLQGWEQGRRISPMGERLLKAFSK